MGSETFEKISADRVMFADREAILLLGDRDEIVARAPAPEAG
jgi:hypothetical protein